MKVTKEDDNTFHLTVDQEELDLLYAGLNARAYELRQNQEELKEYEDDPYEPVIKKARAMARQILHTFWLDSQ